MITAIREVRRAKGLTLDAVARRCTPPTTAQTIGRLETGTRTVSMAWLNRIADALEVDPADLLRLPDRPDLPVAALLGPRGAQAPRRGESAVPARPAPGMLAVRVTADVGDYRTGDLLWCERLAPDRAAHALNRDVLAPLPAGRFAFGRLLAIDSNRLAIAPPLAGSPPQSCEAPAWIACAVQLVRKL